jgi:uncharacterized membrane protein AbrB (regulator of aidB expression)
MKEFIFAIFLMLGLLAGLAIASAQVPAATMFGLVASLTGTLVVGISVMVLSRKRSHRG